jgi:hypothetical protein
MSKLPRYWWYVSPQARIPKLHVPWYNHGHTWVWEWVGRYMEFVKLTMVVGTWGLSSWPWVVTWGLSSWPWVGTWGLSSWPWVLKWGLSSWPLVGTWGLSSWPWLVTWGLSRWPWVVTWGLSSWPWVPIYMGLKKQNFRRLWRVY